MANGSATIPAGTVPGLPEDAVLEVEFTFDPGSAPTIGGPPESCDPGDPPEIESIDCALDGQPFKPTDEQDSAICDWLYANADLEPDYDSYEEWD